jgi:sortase A
VFRSVILNPDDASYITRPVPGKSIVSLQTCTLPDYAQRLIVQAELTAVG